MKWPLPSGPPLKPRPDEPIDSILPVFKFGGAGYHGQPGRILIMSPTIPGIRWHLADSGPISEPDERLWMQIPMDRFQAAGMEPIKGPQSCSYRDYFEGIRSFFERIDDLPTAVGLDSKDDDSCTISGIDVFEEKHGALYHPARVEIQTALKTHIYVLNVAVSDVGRRFAAEEYSALKELTETYPFPFLPKVYHYDQVRGGDHVMAMFLAEWFSGYCEFHWTIQGPGSAPCLMLWDPERGRSPLSPAQIASIFRQAAMLLVSYYHPLTFEHIASWHHAAGDFVVRKCGETLDVRLISVRQYIPIIKIDRHHDTPLVDQDRIVDALLLCFTRICTQMRIDRSDGVGPLLLAPTEYLPPVVTGFFEGLSLGAKAIELSDIFVEAAKTCIKSFFPQKVDALLDEVMRSYRRAGSEEYRLLVDGLAPHRDALLDATANNL